MRNGALLPLGAFCIAVGLFGLVMSDAAYVFGLIIAIGIGSVVGAMCRGVAANATVMVVASVFMIVAGAVTVSRDEIDRLSWMLIVCGVLTLVQSLITLNRKAPVAQE